MIKWSVFLGTIGCVISILSAQPATAQSDKIDSLLAKALATDELLPALIDSALKFSPDLRKAGSNEAYTKANLEISKRAIFSAVNLQSSYIYGTNYTAVNNQSTTVPNSNLTTAQTGFYNLGISVQLPLTYVINRKHILKAGQSQVNMALADNENIQLMIKQEVIRLYQSFKLSQKMMLIGNKSLQTSQVTKATAEKDFLNGQLTVDKLAVVSDSYNKSILEYETYLNSFQTTYMQLEAFTGINLAALITKVQ